MELDTLAPILVSYLPTILSIYDKDNSMVVVATGIQGILKATFRYKVLSTT